MVVQVCLELTVVTRTLACNIFQTSVQIKFYVCSHPCKTNLWVVLKGSWKSICKIPPEGSFSIVCPFLGSRAVKQISYKRMVLIFQLVCFYYVLTTFTTVGYGKWSFTNSLDAAGSCVTCCLAVGDIFASTSGERVCFYSLNFMFSWTLTFAQ